MKNKFIKRSIAVLLTWIMVGCLFITETPASAAKEKATNVGLAAHCLNAYREDWTYVWGGTSYGAVDCSGLIATYNGVGGIRFDMLYSCQSEGRSWGYVSNGIPNIHGLGLHSPGHVGVYVGSDMAVDARDTGIDMCYQNAYSRPWVEWFMITGVDYPTNGWVLLDGKSFYYENGQYITHTTRTLGGVKYTFNSAGVSNIAPPSNSYVSSDGSQPTGKSAPSVSDLKSLSDLSKQTLLLGNSVTVNCHASGGRAPYKYSVYYRKKGSAKWSTVQNYSTNRAVRITPQAAVEYEVRTFVKDSAGSIVQQDLSMTVYKPLCNTSHISTSKIKLGDKAEICCSAEGGAQSYRYSVYYKPRTSEKWIMAYTCVVGTAVIIQPAEPGIYDVRIDVTDARGKTVKKLTSLNVK